MRYRQLKPEESLRRNCITIRLTDAQHRAINNYAWENRTHMGTWMREVALEELAKKGEWENEIE